MSRAGYGTDGSTGSAGFTKFHAAGQPEKFELNGSMTRSSSPNQACAATLSGGRRARSRRRRADRSSHPGWIRDGWLSFRRCQSLPDIQHLRAAMDGRYRHEGKHAIRRAHGERLGIAFHHKHHGRRTDTIGTNKLKSNRIVHPGRARAPSRCAGHGRRPRGCFGFGRSAARRSIRSLYATIEFAIDGNARDTDCKISRRPGLILSIALVNSDPECRTRRR